MSIAEKLITVADNTPLVAAAVKAKKSKNLFNKEQAQYSGAYATGALVNGELVITAKTSNNYTSANYIIPNGEELVGKTLTVSGEWEESSTNKGALRLGWTSLDNHHAMAGSIGATSVSGKSVTKVIGAKPANADKLCLWLYANYDGGAGETGATVTYRDIQVEIGDTATAFTPYTEDFSGISVEASGENHITQIGVSDEAGKVTTIGKNLFDPIENIDGNSRNTTLDGDVITSNFTTGELYVNKNKTVRYPAGSYTLMFVPQTDVLNLVAYLYDADSTAMIGSKIISTKHSTDLT